MPRKVRIGKITRAHGMKGEVKFLPFLIKNPEIILQIPRFYRRTGKDSFETLTPQIIRPAPGGGFLIKFEGVEGRTAAEELQDLELYVDLEELPPKEEDEYYVFELVGLKVILSDDTPLGEVRGLMPVGPYELLEIKRPNRKTIYLPLIEEIVQEINLEKGYIKVAPSPDLIKAQE